EVARPRDLLEATRHLPHPGPQLLLLHPEEVRVVVALLRHPIGDLHRVRTVVAGGHPITGLHHDELLGTVMPPRRHRADGWTSAGTDRRRRASRPPRRIARRRTRCRWLAARRAGR